jgi:hypothetical protein
MVGSTIEPIALIAANGNGIFTACRGPIDRVCEREGGRERERERERERLRRLGRYSRFATWKIADLIHGRGIFTWLYILMSTLTSAF